MSERKQGLDIPTKFWPREGPGLEMELTPGPYPVGFRSGFLPDASRAYDYGHVLQGAGDVDRKPARPVLFAIWYPAQVSSSDSPMRYGDYFDLETTFAAGLPEPLNQAPAQESVTAAEIEAFSQALATYAMEEFMDATLGVSSMSLLDEARRPLLEALLQTPVPNYKNAAFAPGSFPLILYHSGLGGSYEENSILCEYLASQGYIVVSSAYPSASAAYLNIDGDREKSLADMEFIIRNIRSLGAVDGRHIASMGHSFGACVSFLLRKRNDVVDAILSFDSTLDYNKWLDERTREEYVRPSKVFDCPMLVTANGTAQFQIVKGLEYADRYLLTVDDLGHEDFLAHAVIRTGEAAAIQGDAKGATEELGGEKAESHQEQETPELCTETVRIHQAYILQCKLALQFLKKSFQNDPMAHEKLENLVQDGPEKNCVVRLEHVPAKPRPPKLKELAQRIKHDGAKAAMDWCRGQPERDELLFTRSDLNGLGDLQIYAGRPESAVEIFRYMQEVYSDASYGWESLADGYLANKQPEEALEAYRQALAALDRDDSLTDESRVLDKAEYEKAIAGIERDLGGSPH